MRIVALVAMLFIVGCSNSNLKTELSGGNSALVRGTKVYAGYSFSVYRIDVDGVTYLVNSQGGIVPVTCAPKE